MAGKIDFVKQPMMGPQLVDHHAHHDKPRKKRSAKKGKTFAEMAADLDQAILTATEPCSLQSTGLNEAGELIFLAEPIVTGQWPEPREPKPRKPRASKPAAEPPAMLTAAEAAALLGLAPKLIYRMFRDCELKGAKIAGAVRIHRSSVDAYLTSHSNRKPAPPTAAAYSAGETPSPFAAVGGVPVPSAEGVMPRNASSCRRRFPVSPSRCE
jgi:excisionase family DNA binding protein